MSDDGATATPYLNVVKCGACGGTNDIKLCQIQCCVTCHDKFHKLPDISSTEDKSLSAKLKLKETAKEIEENVIPELDKIAEKTRKDRSERRVVVNRVKKEVNTFRKEMKQAVNEACDDVIDKIEHSDIEFDKFIERIKSQKRDALESKKEIDGVIEKGSSNILTYDPPSPRSLVLVEPLMKLTIPIFNPGRDIMPIIREKIGTGLDWDEYTVYRPQTFDSTMIKIDKVVSFKSKSQVKCIVTTGINTAWVLDSAGRNMYQYSGCGEVLRSITVDSSVRNITDMVMRRSGEVLFLCRDGTVRCMSLSGEMSTLIDDLPFAPVGMCLTDRDNLVVGMKSNFSSEESVCHVQMYSLGSEKKPHKIWEMEGGGKRMIKFPYKIVCNGRDLCVVNTIEGRITYRNVLCFNEKGDLRWVYYGKDDKLAHPFTPRGISSDKFYNLLVTDSKNDCVHYIDSEGGLIRIILTHQQTWLTEPGGICVDDKTGQVWIGDFCQNVVKCNYLS